MPQSKNHSKSNIELATTLWILERLRSKNWWHQFPGRIWHSVLSDSLWLDGLQPSRLLCPWDSPGENTGVGCHALLQGIVLIHWWNLHLLCLLLTHYWWECKMVCSPWKRQGQFLARLSTAIWSAVMFLSSHSTAINTYIHITTCMWMFIDSLFIISKKWK